MRNTVWEVVIRPLVSRDELPSVNMLISMCEYATSDVTLSVDGNNSMSAVFVFNDTGCKLIENIRNQMPNPYAFVSFSAYDKANDICYIVEKAAMTIHVYPSCSLRSMTAVICISGIPMGKTDARYAECKTAVLGVLKRRSELPYTDDKVVPPNYDINMPLSWYRGPSGNDTAVLHATFHYKSILEHISHVDECAPFYGVSTEYRIVLRESGKGLFKPVVENPTLEIVQFCIDQEHKSACINDLSFIENFEMDVTSDGKIVYWSALRNTTPIDFNIAMYLYKNTGGKL